MGWRTTFQLFAFGWVFTSSLAAAAEVKSLADLKRHWELYRHEYSKLTTLEYVRDFSGEEKDGRKWNGSLRFAGRHTGKFIKSARIRTSDPTYVVLLNDRYAAELRGRSVDANESWSVLSLNRFSATRDSAVDKALVRDEEAEWNWAMGLRGMSADVGMLESRWCRIISIGSDDAGLIVVTYAKDSESLPDDAPHDPSLSPSDESARNGLSLHPEGWFKLDPRFGYAIVEFEGRNPVRGIVNTETFSDYRRVDGALWFPNEIERISKESGGGTPGDRLLFGKQTSVAVSTAKVDSKEFYISFFGLPEPFDIAKSDNTWRVVVTLLAVLVGIVLVCVAVWRRSKSAGHGRQSVRG
jgi:hypothetical protein